MVSEKKRFFLIKCLWELMTQRGLAILGPRGLIGRIYVFFFFHCKSMGANDSVEVANFDPGAWSTGFM